VGDPDPWCEEADGEYTPPVKGEQIDVEIYNRWEDKTNEED